MKEINILPLNKSLEGKYYEIISLRLNSSEKRRMFDLGFVPKTILKALQKSPLGDPRAYFIRGSVIALREEATRNIIVKEV